MAPETEKRRKRVVKQSPTARSEVDPDTFLFEDDEEEEETVEEYGGDAEEYEFDEEEDSLGW